MIDPSILRLNHGVSVGPVVFDEVLRDDVIRLLGLERYPFLARMWFPGLAKGLDVLSWSNAVRLSGLAAMLVGGRVFLLLVLGAAIRWHASRRPRPGDLA